LEDSSPAGGRWRQRAGVSFLAALLCGMIADAALLWLCGRYQGCYIDGRLLGLGFGVLFPAFALAFLPWDRRKMVISYGCYALSAIIQLSQGNLAVSLFMDGFKRAVLAAGSAGAWEHLRAELARVNVPSEPYVVPYRPSIPCSELPQLAHRVYPQSGALPLCYTFPDETQKSASRSILFVWPSITLDAGFSSARRLETIVLFSERSFSKSPLARTCLL
jgi:hypothetical protein